MEIKKLTQLIVLAVLFSGCAQSQPIDPGQPIGGDRDSGGCLIGAGYSWCEAKQKCLRSWEEPCDEQNTDGQTQCSADSDCVPNPCDCHPHECLNKTEAGIVDCAKPEFCTELYDCGAAYQNEDCLCQSGKCVNENEGNMCN